MFSIKTGVTPRVAALICTIAAAACSSSPLSGLPPGSTIEGPASTLSAFAAIGAMPHAAARMRSATTTTTVVTYTASAVIPASANTTAGTGITNWSIFNGNKLGYPDFVLLGTNQSGGVVWEADMVYGAKYGWVSLNTSTGTNLLFHASSAATVVRDNHVFYDGVYAGGMLLDMAAWAKSGGVGRGRPTTGPISNIKRMGKIVKPAAMPPAGSESWWHGVFDICAFLTTAAASAAGGPVGGFLDGGYNVGLLAAGDMGAISWETATAYCSFGTAPLAFDLITDPLNMANTPLASFSDEITVVAQGDPLDYIPPNFDPQGVQPLPPDPTPPDISGETPVGGGDDDCDDDGSGMGCHMAY